MIAFSKEQLLPRLGADANMQALSEGSLLGRVKGGFPWRNHVMKRHHLCNWDAPTTMRMMSCQA